MKTVIKIFVFALVLPGLMLYAQGKKDREEAERSSGMQKGESILDRAGGTHNKSNISWFFENRGKLYPRRASQGWGLEWPIGSKHEYVYRVNPLVGIPGNVIQGRFTTNEEWEAATGYSTRTNALIAMSDNPNTWPNGQWPVRDAAGKPIIVSNQDSYCVYNDSTNTRGILGIQVNQIGYAFSQKQIKDMIYFTFHIINKSTRTYDSLYFGMYMDLDIGNLSGGAAEWSDDFETIERQRNLVTFSDIKGYSTEWLTASGGYASTGYVGFAMLKTPKMNGKELGITDYHYNTNGYEDDYDIDTVLYGILSSSRNLMNSSYGSFYFHPDSTVPDPDIHFDDSRRISSAGIDVTSWAGSGPYHGFKPGDTLTFVTAWIAGMTREEYDSAYARCKALFESNYFNAQPPPEPKVTAVTGDRRVTLMWANQSESARDPLTGKNIFEGYRVYKSVDKGLHWDQIDRNAFPSAGVDPTPVASFDRVNGIGKDVGIQHSFVDSSLTNGLEYWYAVTAYGVLSNGQILESARGNTSAEQNIAVVIPRWDALGRSAPSAGTLTQTGTGSAQISFQLAATDLAGASARSYDIQFAPVASIEQGNPQSVITVAVDSVGPLTSRPIAMVFTSRTAFRTFDLSSRTILDSTRAYASGVPILVRGLRITLTDTTGQLSDKPTTGDSIVVRLGMRITSATDTVLSLQQFVPGVRYATSTGVIVMLTPTDTTAAHAITYQDRFTFTTTAPLVDQTSAASQLDRIRVVPNPYVVSSLYEQEFGVLRREPIRQLKFTNLPPSCTIEIFTIDGDRVQTIVHNSPNGVETWDLRAAGGREIAAGIYLYLVKTEGGERLERFAVIK